MLNCSWFDVEPSNLTEEIEFSSYGSSIPIQILIFYVFLNLKFLCFRINNEKIRAKGKYC
jgi:hypothetical protein